MSVRLRVMRFFLWASVLGWGIGLGAKLFDLIVVGFIASVRALSLPVTGNGSNQIQPTAGRSNA